MNDLLLRALRGELVERPPAWFFRQAGRYLPEYHVTRAEAGSFLNLCRNPELAAEVTLQPLRRFPFDASIVFNDILVPPAAMGMDLEFVPGRGPVFSDPVRSAADLKRLHAPSISGEMPHVLETIRLLVAQLEVPLFGFAGAPFTLAAYMVEGSGSRHFEHAKALMWGDTTTFQRLLDLNAEIVGDYLQAQIDAGAAAVCLFDTWAGELSLDDWRRYALPAARRALEKVSGAPKLYFTKNASPFLHDLKDVGADGYGLDWRVDLRKAREILGHDVPIMGNLDPIALFAPPQTIHEKVNAILASAGPRGHIFNLGHGVIPTTPHEGVDAALEALHAWSWSARAS